MRIWRGWCGRLSQRCLGIRLRRLVRGFTRCRTYVHHHDCPGLLIDADTTPQVHVRKIKLLKAPKFDLGALLAKHNQGSTDDSGKAVAKDFKEPDIQESV